MGTDLIKCKITTCDGHLVSFHIVHCKVVLLSIRTFIGLYEEGGCLPMREFTHRECNRVLCLPRECWHTNLIQSLDQGHTPFLPHTIQVLQIL